MKAKQRQFSLTPISPPAGVDAALVSTPPLPTSLFI
jgi:hypothetical protein